MKRKSWKRAAAFVTSLAMTTTMLPSDLSGIVTSIVHADEINLSDLSAGSELSETITAEPGETWKVTVLPGTVKDETNGTNAESKTYTGVVIINESGIFDSNDVQAEAVATFRENKDNRDNTGLGIYVASVDAEKKELTLTWEDPYVTDGIHINFEPVWNDITSIKQNGNEVHIPGIDQKFTNVKTGYEYVIRSKKALNIDSFGEDVRFRCSISPAEENAADGAKYIYTFVVGRRNITLALRTIDYTIKNVDIKGAKNEAGEYTTELTEQIQDVNDAAIYVDGTTTALGGTTTSVAQLSPDVKYKIVSEKNDLAVFWDSNNNNNFDVEDQRIASPRSLNTELGKYSYTFTAPYNQIFITRADQNWNFAVTETGDKITATSADIADDSVVYHFGFNVDLDGGATVNGYVPYDPTNIDLKIDAGNDVYDFAIKSVGNVNADEAAAVWSSLSCEVIYSFKNSEGTIIPKPTNAGTYIVAADVYLYDEEGACSTEGESDYHIEKEFKISPLTSEFVVELGTSDQGEAYVENKAKDRAPDNAFKAPNIIVMDGTAPLTKDTHYVLEGDLTAVTAGTHTLLVVGIGDYDGIIKTYNWTSDAAFDCTIMKLKGNEIVEADGSEYEYGDSFNFALADFDGNQDDITYQLSSVFENDLATEYLNADADGKLIVKQKYEAVFGANTFVTPTAVPAPVNVTEDFLIDVRTFDDTAIAARLSDDESKAQMLTAIKVLTGNNTLTYETALKGLHDYINKYTVTALNGDAENPVATAVVTVVPKKVSVSLNQNSVTYDGTDHRSEYKLFTDKVLEKDTNTVNTELGKIAISLTGKTAVIDAGNYTFTAATADVARALGTNYEFSNIEADNKISVVTSIEPINLNGFATASAPETTLVTTGGVIYSAYKKPNITVTAEDGTKLVLGTDYYLAGTISSNKGGDYTTKIHGKNNYTGTITLDWTVLDGASFKKTVNLSWVSATGVINGKGNPAVKFTFNRREVPEFSEGYEVTALGYVYANQEHNGDLTFADLTVDNKNAVKNGNTIKVYKAKTPSFSGNYSLSILDNGYGVTARGFVTIKNIATNTEWTVYTDEYEATPTLKRSDYASAVIAQMTDSFTIEEVQTPPVAYTENEKNKLQAKFTITKDAEASESLRVVEAGYIYSNDAAPAATATDAEKENWKKMTLEAANDTNNAYIKKTSKTTANMSSYTVKFVDKGEGVRYRAFIVVQNEDGAKFTKYIDSYTGSNSAEYTIAENTIKCASYNFAAVSQAQLAALVTVADDCINPASEANDGSPAAQFRTTRTLAPKAADVTVSEYGFIYANELDVAPNNVNNFTVEAANESSTDAIKINKRAGSTISTNGSTYTLNIKKVSDKKIYVRGFVKVKDNKTGIEQYVYSSTVKNNEAPVDPPTVPPTP